MVVPLLLSILLAILGPAGTSAHDPSAYGGLFRSRDDGASWFPADPGLFLSGALGVAISPVDASHLLLATDSGLLRSRNGGRNWTREAPTVLFGSIYAVAFGADARPVSGAGSLALRPMVRLGWGAFSAHPLVTTAGRASRGRAGSRLDG